MDSLFLEISSEFHELSSKNKAIIKSFSEIDFEVFKKELGQRREQGTALHFKYYTFLLANAYTVRGDYEKSTTILKDLYFQNLSSDKSFLCKIINLLRINYDKLQNYIELLVLSKEQFNICGERVYSLHYSYLQLGLYEKAIPLYKKYIGKDSLNPLKFGEMYTELGAFQLKLDKEKKANENYLKAIKILENYEAHDTLKKEALFRLNKAKGGYAYFKIKDGDYKEAKQFLDQEYSTSESYFKADWEKKDIWTLYAKLYLKIADYDRAGMYLDSISHYPTETFFLLKAEYYESKNDFKNAAKAYHDYFNTKNNNVKFESNSLSNSTQILLNYEKRLRLTYKNKQEALIISKEIELQRKSVILLVFIYAILFVVAIIILNLWYLRRKQRRLIQEQKQTLLTHLKDNSTLINEVEHRVKNNLQIIKSLLNIDLKNLATSFSPYVFQESTNRIKVLTNIHQLLDQHNDFREVYLQDYIIDVVTDLLLVFDSDQNIQSKINIAPALKLETDQVVVLGLIINEMLTNTIKYAFDTEVSPQIKIIVDLLPNDKITFQYEDNGKGFDWSSIYNGRKKMGISLIQRLIQQLGGDPIFSTSDGVSLYFSFNRN